MGWSTGLTHKQEARCTGWCEQTHCRMRLGLQATHHRKYPPPDPTRSIQQLRSDKQKTTISSATRHQVCSHPSVTRLSFCDPQWKARSSWSFVKRVTEVFNKNDGVFPRVVFPRSSKALSFCISSAEDGSSCRGTCTAGTAESVSRRETLRQLRWQQKLILC